MADFIWTPDLVVPLTPRYNIIETQSEDFKRRFYEVDSNEEQLYDLIFGEISKSLTSGPNYRDALYSHYTTNKGVLNSFSWTVPPSSISGSPIAVRYSDYQETPDANYNVWNVRIQFRVEV